MFLSLSTLPYSMYSLLVDKVSVINDAYSYRPDKVVRDHYGSDFLIEAFCNGASNISAISMEPGTEYMLPSRLFLKYFKEV